jgi:hypothetical protein
VTTVSLRLPDDLLKAAEQQARVVIAQQKREHLMSVSRRVAANSITVNAEFEAIEDAPNA